MEQMSLKMLFCKNTKTKNTFFLIHLKTKIKQILLSLRVFNIKLNINRKNGKKILKQLITFNFSKKDFF